MQKEMIALRTIREVAEIIDVPQHVLRFWETRFSEIKPLKHNGGRRYYRPEDIELLKGIRHLLYGEGYTIRGVQRLFREEGGQAVRQAAGHALCPVGMSSVPSLAASSPEDSLADASKASISETSFSEKSDSTAQQLSMISLESEAPLPLRDCVIEEREPLIPPVRSLPKSPLPPLPKAPLPPPELFLGFAPDPTPRTKMGDDPYFRTSCEQNAFLRGQLREALNHLKECKRMLDLTMSPENNPSQNTS